MRAGIRSSPAASRSRPSASRTRSDDPETEEELARFRREAQAAGRLTHPNIVGVFDYGETGDLAYIVMEYVDGPSLKSLLDKQERFAIADTMRIMADLLAGLQFSHERGVVHRDIKPANVMLTSDGQAKIADFGIARIESSSMTQAGTVLGTPAYMSPEQFMGQVVDARTDIYSSGVLLYQLLTGERPFEGGMSAIMHKALNTDPPLPSQITVTCPAAFDAVVRKAMAKRPEDRFQSASEFLEALQAAAAGRPVAGSAPDEADDSEATMVVRFAAPGRGSGRGTCGASRRCTVRRLIAGRLTVRRCAEALRLADDRRRGGGCRASAGRRRVVLPVARFLASSGHGGGGEHRTSDPRRTGNGGPSGRRVDGRRAGDRRVGDWGSGSAGHANDAGHLDAVHTHAGEFGAGNAGVSTVPVSAGRPGHGQRAGARLPPHSSRPAQVWTSFASRSPSLPPARAAPWSMAAFRMAATLC